MTELLGLDTRQLYLGLIVLVVVERLFELRLARRNLRWAEEHGGVEAGAGHFPVMVVVHTLFLLACPLEVFLLHRPFVPALALSMTLLLAATMALRYWAVKTLGVRWSPRVVVVPGLPAVDGGPYRYLRHPNYLAVVLEIVALPMIHGAYLTAVAFSLANAALLAVRIPVEEAALAKHNDYQKLLGDRAPLVPRRRG
jgi:methyltransferase